MKNMHEGSKVVLGFCGGFAIIIAVILSDMTIAAQAFGESQMTTKTSKGNSIDLIAREKELSLDFFSKVKRLDSYKQRKQALVKKYIQLSLKLEKMQVIMHGLQSEAMALSGNTKENSLMLEHRKIVSEKHFALEQIREGLLRQYKLLENLEVLQQNAHPQAHAPSDSREEFRWLKGELRRLEETESWNLMLLKIGEALHYLRTDITKELDLLRKK